MKTAAYSNDAEAAVLFMYLLEFVIVCHHMFAQVSYYFPSCDDADETTGIIYDGNKILRSGRDQKVLHIGVRTNCGIISPPGNRLERTIGGGRHGERGVSVQLTEQVVIGKRALVFAGNLIQDRNGRELVPKHLIDGLSHGV